MGRSYTYNVIGFGIERIKEDDTVWRYEYPCMNLREMAQAVLKAEKNGDVIMGWYSQTKVGTKMLGGLEYTYEGTLGIKFPKLVVCPRCGGNGCGICNFAGYTTKQWLKGFQPWQIEREVK